MTKNEFFTNVANENLTPETLAYARAEVEKVAKQNAVKAEENAIVANAICEFLATQNEPVKAGLIAEAIDSTTSKVTSVCKGLVAEGRISRDSAVIDKRSVYVYALVK